MSLGLPESGERQRRFSSRGFRILLGLLLVSLIGTTFAVNVTINGNNKLEFGQGVYRITSCDQFVNVALKSSSAFADGYSRVGSIELSGLVANGQFTEQVTASEISGKMFFVIPFLGTVLGWVGL